MRKLFLVFAVAAAGIWSGPASAIVDESRVNTPDQGEELNRSTVSLTPTEEKTSVEHRKPEKEHRTTKKHSGSKRTDRAEHGDSEVQRREQVQRTIDMINIGVGVGTSLRRGGGGGGGGGGGEKHHGERHKD